MGCGPGYVKPEWGGPYVYWTAQELLDQMKKVDAAIKNRSAGAGILTSASVNGKSFTYQGSTSTTDSLSQLRTEKQDLVKYHQLAATGEYTGPTNRAVGVFRMPYGDSEPSCS